MANNMAIDDVLLQFVTVDLRIYDKPFLSLEDSMVLLDNWFLHNGWDALEFITNLFRVLTKAAEKVNAFLVMGPSNSGKTMMLLQPLSVLVSNVGRIPSLNAASNNFVWQDCLNTNLICIDECVIQPGSFEEAKQIFAGEDTSINVKHSPQAILKRTPIVACTNRQPWVFAPNEKDALLNRMFMYQTARPFEQLAEYSQFSLSPKVYTLLFSWYSSGTLSHHWAEFVKDASSIEASYNQLYAQFDDTTVEDYSNHFLVPSVP